MQRVVSLFLPAWPTDRLRRQLGASSPPAGAPPAETPLILSARISNRRVVSAANAAAQAQGLRAGMPVSKAQALIPDLVIRDATPEADAEALDRLALWALQRYAPIAAAEPPDGIIIDVTGAAHLHGGEAAMLKDMLDRLAAAGITARAAVADTRGAAHAFARYANRSMLIVPPGESPEAVLRLPIAALRIPADMAGQLRRLGFERIAELADKPRAPLALRFGPELQRRLDQATGRLFEAIDPVRPPELIEVRQMFAEPIGAAETIARYIGKLVIQLCEMLEAKGLGARRLDLLLHRVDSRMQTIRIGTSTPVRGAKQLTRLLCDQIETIDPGFGVEMMRLCAALAEPFATPQITSLLDEPLQEISSLIDTLANRVGENRLYRFALVDSDVPERSVRRVPPISPPTGKTWSKSWPRPSRLFSTPERIDTIAVLPDHPPVSFNWRGKRRRIKYADGPERIFGEWWMRDAEVTAVRDYFRVEDETGERYWIYRSGDGEDQASGSQLWYLHGIFG